MFFSIVREINSFAMQDRERDKWTKRDVCTYAKEDKKEGRKASWNSDRGKIGVEREPTKD